MKSLVSILLILAATFGGATGLSSGGRVLCVSGDRHVSIEGRHVESCASTEAHGHAHGDADDDGRDSSEPCGDDESPFGTPEKACVDHGTAGDTDGRQIRVSAPAHEVAGLATSLHIATPAVMTHSASARWADPPGGAPPSTSLARLATIVLLI